MKWDLIFISLFCILILPKIISAEVQPTTVRLPESSAWVGERLRLFVDLRANGSFDGAASFSIPEIPRTLLIKIGNPIVSSEEIEGESWFVQTHEFALFSQQSGIVTIPEFQVRFSHRTGFTGPVEDKQGIVPATTVEIRRPEGSDENAFLVTTSSLKITETWDALPDRTQPGAIFRRTISQQADQITGMALAPPSLSTPAGVRAYANHPEVVDRTERGNFVGNRSDTITYIMQQPGTWKIPAVTYVWWDPDKELFGSQTLPEVIFNVSNPPQSASNHQDKNTKNRTLIWLILLFSGFVAASRYRSIGNWLRHQWRSWNPPDRLAARKLLKACHDNDASVAESAWNEWRLTQSVGFQPNHQLADTVLEMQRQRYGPNDQRDWKGQPLATAFRDQLHELRKTIARNDHQLPALNE